MTVSGYIHILGLPGFIIGLILGGFLGAYYGWKEGNFMVTHITILAAAVTGIFVIPITGSAFIAGSLSGGAVAALVAFSYERFSNDEIGSEILMIIILGAASAVGAVFVASLINWMGENVIAAYVGLLIGLLVGIVVGISISE